MKIDITEDHIKEVAEARNYKITDMDAVKKYIRKKAIDECREDGATHLCVFLENILVEAAEDAEDFIEHIFAKEKHQ